MKRMIALLIGFLLSVAANAQDGLVIHFKITKSLGHQSSSYTDTVLLRVDESVTIALQGLYEMHADAKAIDGGHENLVFAIKDLSSGVPIFIGSAAVTLEVGQSQTVFLHQLEAATTNYMLFVDTAYGQLPRAIH